MCGPHMLPTYGAGSPRHVGYPNMWSNTYTPTFIGVSKLMPMVDKDQVPGIVSDGWVLGTLVLEQLGCP